MHQEFDDLGAAIAAGDIEHVSRLKAKIVEASRGTHGFQYLELSVIRYYPPTPGLYATIDVVEKDDHQRMPFRQPPSGEYDDLDGLVAHWHE